MTPVVTASAGGPPIGGPPVRRSTARTVLLAVAVVVVVAVAAVVVSLRLRDRGWRMVWSDEFDGSSVSASQWNVRNETYLPYEESILTSRPENVRVGAGMLTLEARRENRTVFSTNRDYTSAYLDTIGKHSWRYARFEMRAQLPLATGLWPAFWLRGDKGLGEIDVMEAIGGMPTYLQQTVLESTLGGKGKLVNQYTLPDGGRIDGWHVYGATVAPDSITFTVDGKQVYRATTRQAPWLSSTFAEPMNIRLNLQVGGTLPDYYHHPLDASTHFPADYRVDWVHVYQRA